MGSRLIKYAQKWFEPEVIFMDSDLEKYSWRKDNASIWYWRNLDYHGFKMRRATELYLFPAPACTAG
jgi:hypothetical protein